MRKLLLGAMALLFLAVHAHAQAPASDIFQLLKEMPDQNNQSFDPVDLGDEAVIIFVPGAENPFQKFYTKKKAAQLKPNALLVGGFKEMMNNMSPGAKKKHLQEALAMRYKEGQMLLDLDSKLGELLSLQGYSIIRLSKKENKVLEINDFAFDRVAFFKALQKYEQMKEKEGTDD